MNYYDDCDEFKVNNWSVNALIKKNLLKVHVDTSGIYNLEYAVLTEKAGDYFIKTLKDY
jgi:hypothetical protein